MSKIGKRIKSVILKGKTFWNWKKEDDINVNIPVPKDYRNKVSYETNVEFIFNREVIASFSYNDPSQIPSMDDVRDPVWEEDDRRNEEYIRIHGEVELDDEEE